MHQMLSPAGSGRKPSVFVPGKFSSCPDTRQTEMPSPAVVFAWLIFGVVGIAAFTYGRKRYLWRPMGIGVALMAFPYFVSQAWLLYAIGLALCGALYIWRD
jgi:hypothetical protein